MGFRAPKVPGPIRILVTIQMSYALSHGGLPFPPKPCWEIEEVSMLFMVKWGKEKGQRNFFFSFSSSDIMAKMSKG